MKKKASVISFHFVRIVWRKHVVPKCKRFREGIFPVIRRIITKETFSKKLRSKLDFLERIKFLRGAADLDFAI